MRRARVLVCGAAEDEGGVICPGLLGLDINVLRVPTPVPSLAGTRVHSVAAGHDHTLVLTEAGTMLSFGSGAEGRLGHGDEVHQLQPPYLVLLKTRPLYVCLECS